MLKLEKKQTMNDVAKKIEISDKDTSKDKE